MLISVSIHIRKIKRKCSSRGRYLIKNVFCLKRKEPPSKKKNFDICELSFWWNHTPNIQVVIQEKDSPQPTFFVEFFLFKFKTISLERTRNKIIAFLLNSSNRPLGLAPFQKDERKKSFTHFLALQLMAI